MVLPLVRPRVVGGDGDDRFRLVFDEVDSVAAIREGSLTGDAGLERVPYELITEFGVFLFNVAELGVPEGGEAPWEMPRVKCALLIFDGDDEAIDSEVRLSKLRRAGLFEVSSIHSRKFACSSVVFPLAFKPCVFENACNCL